MRAAVLVTALSLLSGVAAAQQTCTTRADGSFNCTTTTAAAAPAAATPTVTGPRERRVFQPDDSGLIRIPTLEGEVLFHCDSNGPCKELGLNPLPLNR
jgi:hypothetical protein